MNQKGDGEMGTATALPTTDDFGKGFRGALGKLFTRCLNGRGLPPERVRINIDKNKNPLPIKQQGATTKEAPTNKLIPGIPLLAKGSGTNMQHYIIINKETFYVDPCCHLLDIAKANENWKKSVAEAKGIIYDEKCQSILAYATHYYLEIKKGKMPALQRICVDTNTRRNELFERFPGSPGRTIAMIIGAPARFETEDLEKAPKIPFW